MGFHRLQEAWLITRSKMNLININARGYSWSPLEGCSIYIQRFLCHYT
jgi:hypothetical protein